MDINKLDTHIEILHKNINYSISNIEIERGIEKNLHDDLEFSCREDLQSFKIKQGMYRELSKINIIMAFNGDKTKYHIETLLTHAIVNNSTADLYDTSYKHLK